jgi:hypothetical protein
MKNPGVMTFLLIHWVILTLRAHAQVILLKYTLRLDMNSFLYCCIYSIYYLVTLKTGNSGELLWIE